MLEKGIGVWGETVKKRRARSEIGGGGGFEKAEKKGILTERSRKRKGGKIRLIDQVIKRLWVREKWNRPNRRGRGP